MSSADPASTRRTRVAHSLEYSPELESALREWLSELLGDRAGEMPRSGAGALAGALRGGATLCRVANAIIPKSVARVHAGNVPFLQMQNIAAYLEVAPALGVPRELMFTLSDLWEQKDHVLKILHHLRAVAEAAARRPDYKGPIFKSPLRIKSMAGSCLVLQAQEQSVYAEEDTQPPQSAAESQLVEWANKHLANCQPPCVLHNLSGDIRNALKLITLVEALTGATAPDRIAQPKSLDQCLENARKLSSFVAKHAGCDLPQGFTEAVSSGNAQGVCSVLAFLRRRLDSEYIFQRELEEKKTPSEPSLSVAESPSSLSPGSSATSLAGSSCGGSSPEALARSLSPAGVSLPVPTLTVQQAPAAPVSPQMDAPAAHPLPGLQDVLPKATSAIMEPPKTADPVTRDRSRSDSKATHALLSPVLPPLQKALENAVEDDKHRRTTSTLDEDKTPSKILVEDLEQPKCTATVQSIQSLDKQKSPDFCEQTKRSTSSGTLNGNNPSDSSAVPQPPAPAVPQAEAAVVVDDSSIVAQLLMVKSREDAKAERKFPTTGWPCLASILHDPVLRLDFQAFLESEFAQENIQFLDSVDAWIGKALVQEATPDGRAEVLQEAKQISETYCFEGSPREVNISGEARKDIEQAISSTSGTLPPQLFDAAVAEVRRLVESDLCPSIFASGSGVPYHHIIESTKAEKAAVAVRAKFVKKIVEAERSYVANLELLVSDVIDPLVGWEILTPDEMWSIFGNVADLLIHHKKFLAKLSEKTEGWNSHKTIGDLFLCNTQFFVLYSLYNHNYPGSLVALRTLLCSRPLMALRVSKFQKMLSQKSNLTIDGLLGLVFSRLSTYVGQLHGLLQYTVSSHPDLALLEKAYNWVEGIQKSIDATTDNARLAAARTLLGAADCIEGRSGQDLIAEGRTLIKEGPVYVELKNSSNDFKPIAIRHGYLFLFSDLLVCCELKKSKPRPVYTVMSIIPHKNMLRPTPGCLSNGHLAVVVTSSEDHRWMISSMEDSESKNWTKELASWYGN
eukprot:m51a1_g2338 hypothetical protein (1020) ;mRNA; f:545178-549102